MPVDWDTLFAVNKLLSISNIKINKMNSENFRQQLINMADELNAMKSKFDIDVKSITINQSKEEWDETQKLLAANYTADWCLPHPQTKPGIFIFSAEVRGIVFNYAIRKEKNEDVPFSRPPRIYWTTIPQDRWEGLSLKEKTSIYEKAKVELSFSQKS